MIRLIRRVHWGLCPGAGRIIRAHPTSILELETAQQSVPITVHDPRTERWFYPGYTTIYLNGVRQCNASDSTHAAIMSEWTNPQEFVQAHQCPSGQILCGTTCVDLTIDPSNCGSCGHACASGTSCVGGSCTIQPGQLTLISGNGNIGDLDPLNQYTLDGGATFSLAPIVYYPYSSDTIAGTQWINWNPNINVGPFYASTFYRTTFELPAGFTIASLTVLVHADNVATIYLNGVQVGQQTFAEIFQNFQGPAKLVCGHRPYAVQRRHQHLGLRHLQFQWVHSLRLPGHDCVAVNSLKLHDRPACKLRRACFSNCNPLDLVERDLVAGAVVELGRARRLVRRDLLRVLQRAAVLEVGGDAGGAEGVAADRGLDAGGLCPPADHSPRVRLSERVE